MHWPFTSDSNAIFRLSCSNFPPFLHLLLLFHLVLALTASAASSLPQYKDATASPNEPVESFCIWKVIQCRFRTIRGFFLSFFFFKDASPGGVMRGQVIDCRTQNELDNESFKCSSSSSFYRPRLHVLTLLIHNCQHPTHVSPWLIWKGKRKRYKNGTLDIFCTALK